jgi:hypothetical protein
VRTFKFSRDLQFVAELQNIVGPVSDSAEHAIVLCADEKSQIQVLDRTQSSPPPEEGRCGTMSQTTNVTAQLLRSWPSLPWEGELISICDDPPPGGAEISARYRTISFFPKPISMVVDNSTPQASQVSSAGFAAIPRFHCIHARQLFAAQRGGILPRLYREPARYGSSAVNKLACR